MPTSLKSTPCGPRVLDAASLGDHLDRLLRAALSLTGSRPDAEDLVQEVCLRVLAKPRVVRGSEIAYLHGVLRNTFFSDYQQRARRRTVPVEPETLSYVTADSRFDPETATLAREVHRAIGELPGPLPRRGRRGRRPRARLRRGRRRPRRAAGDDHEPAVPRSRRRRHRGGRARAGRRLSRRKHAVTAPGTVGP